MALPGVRDSECQQVEAEDHKLLGPGDCISCQAVSRLYSWAAPNHGFLGSGTVYSCQECHNLRSAPLRRCTAHHGLCLCGVSEKLPRLNLNSAQKWWPTRDYDTAAILRAWVALWNRVLWNILEPEHIGPVKCMRQRAYLGLCSSRTPGHLALGRAGDVWLSWDWAFREHSGIWAF